MIWTHIYDLILKVGIFILTILTFFKFPFFIDKGPFAFIIALILSVVIYLLYLRTIGSYLYCRLNLKMKLNFHQSKQLNDALSPLFNRKLQWLPLKEVKNLNDEVKFETALQLLENWKKENQLESEKTKDAFKNASLPMKTIEIISGIGVVGAFFSVVFVIPPGSYFIALYCETFNTNEYSPQLLGMLFSIIFALPLFLYKKYTKNNSH